MAEAASKADIENVVTLLQQNFESVDRQFEAVNNRLERIADTLAGVQSQMGWRVSSPAF